MKKLGKLMVLFIFVLLYMFHSDLAMADARYSDVIHPGSVSALHCVRFSISLPEGLYLLNADTVDLLQNDPELWQKMKWNFESLNLDALSSDLIVDANGLLKMRIDNGGYIGAEQNRLKAAEGAFSIAAQSEFEENGYTNFHSGMETIGDNLFFVAFAQTELWNELKYSGIVATIDSDGNAVEIQSFLDEDTTRAILKTMSGYTYENVTASETDTPSAEEDERPIYDTLEEISSLGDIYIWEDRLMFTKNEHAVSIYSKYGEYALPDTGELELPSDISGLPVVQIGSDAFKGSGDIVRVTIPASVQRIRSGSFDSMEVLTEVVLEEGVSRIEDTFNQCPKLFNVKIPSSVVSIADSAFDTGNPYFHLTVEKGSYGEKFAEDHSIPYVYANERAALSVSPGNTVSFGKYNGESVEWLVLKTEENEALLLSKDVLTSQRYSTPENAMWASSDINRYLNERLIYELFSLEEADLLTAHRIYDPASPYNISGLPGKSDVCHMFLLSYFEARDLLPADEQRTASDNWWLRTSRDYSEYTHYVSADGVIREGSEISESLGIRPALWVHTDNADGIIKIIDESIWTEKHEDDDDIFSVGDVIQLGSYEQDNDTANGAEALDWLVLDVNGTSATLITQYCIDVQQYHSTDKSINWGESSLRNWLNNDFLNTAFSVEDQSALILTGVENFDTDTARNSMMYSYMIDPVVSYDLVWILDDDELERYLPEPQDQLAYVTEYASARGAASNNEGYGTWLLRTDKNDENQANILLPYEGDRSVVVTRSDASIRPVIKVDLVILGIVEATEPLPESSDAEMNWDNTNLSLTSKGKGDPEKGTEWNAQLLDKVVAIQDEIGGWFRLTAPKDGDYYFLVLAPDIQRSTFCMEISISGEHRASLRFNRSGDIQMGVLENVKAGDVITWWDNDDSGRYYTLRDPFKLMITASTDVADAFVQMGSAASSTIGFVYPENGATINGEQPLETQWNLVDGADSYSVIVEMISSAGREFWWSDGIYDDECDRLTIPEGTLPAGKYALRLSAWYGEGTAETRQVYEDVIEITVVSDVATVYEDFTYAIQDDGTALVTGITGSDTVRIPPVIDGHEVTAIADGVAYWNSALRGVQLPDTVTTIGSNAFAWCMSLQYVEIGANVARIGDNAFSNDSQLTELSFPESLTHLGVYVGSECKGLRFVNLPGSLTDIGEGVFSGCDDLFEVQIGEGITEIPPYAFLCCAKIESLVLPQSLTRIGDMAFYGCESIAAVEIPGSVAFIGEWAFSQCPMLTNTRIPEGILVGEGAFE